MTRIALISDIHFGKDARTKEFSLPDAVLNGEIKNAPSLSKGAIEIIRKMQAEFLFVAGDMTSVGSPAEYHFCERKILEIADEARIDSDHVIWCVGNHDNDWSISGLTKQYAGHDESIQKIMSDKYGEMASFVAQINMTSVPKFESTGPVPVSGIYSFDNMIVFVLNSSSECVQKEIIEHGSLTKEQLTWLEKELKKYTYDRRWKIVLMHHHPFNYAYPGSCFDVSQLEEGSEFCEIVGKNGVNLVLHGHRHHPRCVTKMENEWCGAVSFVCSGSFSVGEDQRWAGAIPNTLHIMELQDRVGELVMYSYEYSIGTGWQPINLNRPEVPLDHKMYLGKTFQAEQINVAIKNIFEGINDSRYLEWTELGEPLRYISSNRVKELIKESGWIEKFDVKVIPMEGLFVRKK